MPATSDNPHPHDRHTDPVAPAGRPAAVPGEPGLARKPPVLRRSTLRAICVIWLGLVVYGTLGPLGYGEGVWLAAADNWRWIPPTYAVNYNAYNDLFTNVLVYVPVGVALALLIRRRGGARGLELLLAMSLAVSLSYVTELLQQFMPARCSDRADLIFNSGAALLGCLVAPHAQRVIRRGHQYAYEHWRHRPWLAAAWVMTGLTLALMTLPWDVYWPSVEIDYRRGLDSLDFRRFVTFCLLGFLIAMAMVERHGLCARAFGEAIKRIFVCGVLFEAAQIFIRSHACGLLDMSTALLGGLAGIGAARWLAALSSTRGNVPTVTRQLLATAALLALAAFGLVAGIGGGAALGDHPQGLELVRVPFQLEFRESFDRVLISAGEALFLYAAVTALCLYLTQGSGRRVALLLLMGMVGVAQLGKVLLLRGAADVTPLFMALAAWLVVVRCWSAFAPPGHHPARRQFSH
jgi:VanZ family protein